MKFNTFIRLPNLRRHFLQMNNENNGQSEASRQVVRDLSDAKIMGATPRLNLEQVYDDPFLIQAKEKSIIELSDQIIQKNRENNTDAYNLSLKSNLIKLRNHGLKKKEMRLKKRDQRAKSKEIELTYVLNHQNSSEENLKNAKTEFEKVKKSFEETIDSFGKLIQSSVDEPNETKESDSTEETTDPEKLAVLAQIKEAKQSIEKGKQVHRSAQFQETVYDVQFAELLFDKNSLAINIKDMQDRIQKLSKRYDKASKKKANPYDPVHFEEGLIEQIEKTADDAEKRLNRSRVDAIEYALQHEYSSYQALQEENQKRRQSLAERHKILKAAKRKQQERAAIIQKMAEKMKEDTIEKEPSLDNATEVLDNQDDNDERERQDRLDQLNADIDDLEKATKKNREETEAQYDQLIEQVQVLNQNVMEIDEYMVQLATKSNEIDNLRLQEQDLLSRLDKLTKTKEFLSEKVKNTLGREQYSDKELTIGQRKELVDTKEKELRIKRETVLKAKLEVEDLQKTIDEKLANHADNLKAIDELGNQITSKITTVEELSDFLNVLHIEHLLHNDIEEANDPTENQSNNSEKVTEEEDTNNPETPTAEEDTNSVEHHVEEDTNNVEPHIEEEDNNEPHSANELNGTENQEDQIEEEEESSGIDETQQETKEYSGNSKGNQEEDNNN